MSAEPLFFSVLIVNYNAGEYLARCLKALREQSFEGFEAIVVDNDSRDDSLARCSEHWSDPRIRLEKLASNTGFAAGNNHGARLARGKWIVTLNPDAFPDADWLATLARAAQKYPDVDMFGCTQINAADPSRLDGVGDAYLAVGIPWRSGYGHTKSGAAAQDYETFGPCAAAAMYRAASFTIAGGFDESFFCYVEDADLAFRLRLAGSRCVQVHDAVVRHVGGASSDAAGVFARYHGIRNLIWVFVKNMPSTMFLLILPAHVLALLILIVKSVHRGNGGVTSEAIVDALRGLPAVWQRRRKIQASRRASTKEIARALCWNPKTYLLRNVHVIGPARKESARTRQEPNRAKR